MLLEMTTQTDPWKQRSNSAYSSLTSMQRGISIHSHLLCPVNLTQFSKHHLPFLLINGDVHPLYPPRLSQDILIIDVDRIVVIFNYRRIHVEQSQQLRKGFAVLDSEADRQVP